jgi:hypothetical protein
LGIEVTQAIQCFDQSHGYTKCPDNSLELTDGRTTAVRVYVGHTGGYSVCPAPQTSVLKVRVELSWAAPHTDLPPGSAWFGTEKSQTFSVPCSTDLNELRGIKEGSATFLFPPELLGKPGKQKSLWLEARVVADTIQESNQNNNSAQATVSLFPRRRLNVKWMHIYYQPDDTKKCIGSPYTGAPFAKKDLKDSSTSALMEKLYPMPVDYSRYSWFLVYGSMPEKGFTCSFCPDVRCDSSGYTLLSKLESHRNTMKPRPDALIGWLPEGARGHWQLKGGSAWDAAWCFHQSSLLKNQICLAHEIGHTQNLSHPIYQNNCIPDSAILETGFDTVDKLPVEGSDLDFMGQAGGTWISPYHWNVLLDKPDSPEWSKCSTSVSAAEKIDLAASNPAPQPAILVRGRVYLDGTAELDTLYQFVSEGPFPPSNRAGDYCLDFLSGSGSVLGSNCFQVSFVAPESGEATDTAPFTFVLPAPALTKQLVLRYDTAVLAERVASPHAPELTIVAPESGERVMSTATFSWSASDEDGDDLRFAVFYSHDSGDTWLPVAFDIQGNGLQVDSAWLAGGPNAQIRVLASDGFNTITAYSEPFGVSRKVPHVQIGSPANKAIVHPMEAIVLTGHADDLEDGMLEDSALTWTSDRQGFLGSGSQLILPGLTLDPGVHEITLTATDSDGQRGMASVTTFVGYGIYIPLSLRSGL